MNCTGVVKVVCWYAANITGSIIMATVLRGNTSSSVDEVDVTSCGADNCPWSNSTNPNLDRPPESTVYSNTTHRQHLISLPVSTPDIIKFVLLTTRGSAAAEIARVGCHLAVQGHNHYHHHVVNFTIVACRISLRLK